VLDAFLQPLAYLVRADQRIIADKDLWDRGRCYLIHVFELEQKLKVGILGYVSFVHNNLVAEAVKQWFQDLSVNLIAYQTEIIKEVVEVDLPVRACCLGYHGEK